MRDSSSTRRSKPTRARPDSRGGRPARTRVTRIDVLPRASSRPEHPASRPCATKSLMSSPIRRSPAVPCGSGKGSPSTCRGDEPDGEPAQRRHSHRDAQRAHRTKHSDHPALRRPCAAPTRRRARVWRVRLSPAFAGSNSGRPRVGPSALSAAYRWRAAALKTMAHANCARTNSTSNFAAANAGWIQFGGSAAGRQ